MKKLMMIFCVSVLCMGMLVDTAEARRMGGGKSLGMNRSPSVMNRDAAPVRSGTPTQNAAPSSAAAPAAGTPPRAGMSRWLGPIAGLAAGIGLAAMLSHFGMGEGVANFLLIALLAMGAIFLLRRFLGSRPAGNTLLYPQPVAANPAGRQEPMVFDAQKIGAGDTAASIAAQGTAGNIPADFDVEGFLRQAKLSFVRLQAANDRGDMEDIRLFSTPEVAAEIQLQFQERQRATQQTDVVQLAADLLDVSIETSRYVASVRFHGQLREDAQNAPEAFSEVWHLVKPLNGASGWQVAGIQQD
ncbi:MAG: Tim44 domain-containing protein [Rugosibacter sp.]|nr:MAG: Tim44 domain-containing protein [Rugosibacter sp.]TBR07793.1 MAG: Tim44 domain-containing protein [Rugosibacter sp.]